MPQDVSSLPHQSPQKSRELTWGGHGGSLGNEECHGEGLGKVGAKACSLHELSDIATAVRVLNVALSL